MPDQDNVSLEKISLSPGDFTEDLNDDFGIKDTQLLATRDLQTFLQSDPDDVQSVEDEAKKAEALKKVADDKKALEEKQRQQSQETPEEKITREAKEKEERDKKPDGKTALEAALFNNNNNEDEDELDENGKKKPLDTNKATSTNQGDDTFNTLSKDLLKLGVFSKNSDDETEENIKIKTPEEFLERFNLEKKKGAIGILDNFLGQFGEEYREMFDSVFVKGIKPQDYLNSFAKIEAISGLDLTQEANQERVVRAYYKDLKWDDTKIDGKITKLKDYGDLEDEAKTYHEVLLNKEKDALANEEQQKTEELQKKKDKDTATFNSFKRILTEKLKTQDVDGIPLTPKDSEDVLDYLTSQKYKLTSGELLSEFDKDLLELNRPENHEMKIKLGLLLRKKLDLSSIKKTTISKKSDELFTLSTKNAKQQSKEKEIKSFF